MREGCADGRACGTNQYYNDPICRDKISNGDDCDRNDQCTSGSCINQATICSSRGCSALGANIEVVDDFLGWTGDLVGITPPVGWEKNYLYRQPVCGRTVGCDGIRADNYLPSNEYDNFVSSANVGFLGDYAVILSLIHI